MYTLVLTAPSTPTHQFHEAKHRAEAKKLRNSRFSRFTGSENRSGARWISIKPSAGSINTSP
ncbi:hypothetical protein D3C81_2284180 [compost metagenome]